MLALHLSPVVRGKMQALLSRGVSFARTYKKIQVLLFVDDGMAVQAAAKLARVSTDTASKVCRRFKDGGLDAALYDFPRSGRPVEMERSQEEKIVAMVCALPPEGFSRWTIPAITKEAVRRGIVGHLSNSTVCRLLHRHALKPWREKNVVCSRANGGIYNQDGRRTKDV